MTDFQEQFRGRETNPLEGASPNLAETTVGVSGYRGIGACPDQVFGGTGCVQAVATKHFLSKVL